MPRYYFHFLSPDDAVLDKEGVELEGYEAAYDHACGLVHQVRIRFPASKENWWIEIGDGTGTPATILPAMIPGTNIRRLRARFPRASERAS
jgi:Domain of unknown function (DUF6894)